MGPPVGRAGQAHRTEETGDDDEERPLPETARLLPGPRVSGGAGGAGESRRRRRPPPRTSVTTPASSTPTQELMSTAPGNDAAADGG
ncbi:hypothetical protein [Dietzia sp. PP-33]|uniref:hypothetical protein n=1 Tax=Dietzia sp. PP-33 TaxID=2957500 RepID=UPI0029BF5357|nr:hypothetical protein [Dietzia sp. PP-33]MDX2358268.1 hypothetical protein [Dietzia sp. PP-33]